MVIFPGHTVSFVSILIGPNTGPQPQHTHSEHLAGMETVASSLGLTGPISTFLNSHSILPPPLPPPLPSCLQKSLSFFTGLLDLKLSCPPLLNRVHFQRRTVSPHEKCYRSFRREQAEKKASTKGEGQRPLEGTARAGELGFQRKVETKEAAGGVEEEICLPSSFCTVLALGRFQIFLGKKLTSTLLGRSPTPSAGVSRAG